MTWVKLDDAFSQHPKVLSVGPAAAWLYVAALCYCSRLATDGIVPMAALGMLAAIKRPDIEAQRLVAAGLWEDHELGYQVHDYLEYQPSSNEVKATKKKTADRVRTWRQKRIGNDVTNPVSNSVRNAGSNVAGNSVSNALGGSASRARIPSRPVPTTNSESDFSDPTSPEVASSVAAAQAQVLANLDALGAAAAPFAVAEGEEP